MGVVEIAEPKLHGLRLDPFYIEYCFIGNTVIIRFQYVYVYMYVCVCVYIYIKFVFSRAAPTAYGGSQARGLIGAVAASLC